MLEKPNITDETITAHLRDSFGLQNARLDFLPLGADVNTAVYRVTAGASAPFFLKLRSGAFEPMSVLVPRYLSDQGIRQVIQPIRAVNGLPWSRLERFTCVVYPFVEGRNAWDTALSEAQWVEFGAALRKIHALILPEELRRELKAETYSAQYREQVKEFQRMVEQKTFSDPVAARMTAFMRQHREVIDHVTGRAGALAEELAAQPPNHVLCHSDIHAGNLMVTASGELYIVDWDEPLLAPRERDLMFIGGGVGGNWNTVREEALFYQGYGAAEINKTALAHYRYEREVQDIAAYCAEILLTTEGGEDRERSLGFFTGSFAPGSVIDIARRTDENLSR